MNSYARGYKLLHTIGEILQTRHIPQSPSGDLKHKIADTTLWIRKGLIYLLPGIGPIGRWKSHFRFPLFLLSSRGICKRPLSKLRCCTGWPQYSHLNPPRYPAWKKMSSKGLRDVTGAVRLLWCHMVLIISLLPRQLPAEVALWQQAPAHGAAPAASAQGQTWTYLPVRKHTTRQPAG